MTNKFYSMVESNRISIASDLTLTRSRFDTVLSASFYRVLPILLLCLSLFLSAGHMWGATETATSSTSTLVASTTYYDMESGKLIEVKNSANNSYSNPLRIYANNTFTFHCKSGATKITKIVLSLRLKIKLVCLAGSRCRPFLEERRYETCICNRQSRKSARGRRNPGGRL